jgi:hypothetical protein
MEYASFLDSSKHVRASTPLPSRALTFAKLGWKVLRALKNILLTLNPSVRSQLPSNLSLVYYICCILYSTWWLAQSLFTKHIWCARVGDKNFEGSSKTKNRCKILASQILRARVRMLSWQVQDILVE